MSEDVRKYELFGKNVIYELDGYTCTIDGYYSRIHPLRWSSQLRMVNEYIRYRAMAQRVPGINKAMILRESMKMLSTMISEIKKTIPPHVNALIKEYNKAKPDGGQRVHLAWLTRHSATALTKPVALAMLENRGLFMYYVNALECGLNPRGISRAIRDGDLDRLFGYHDRGKADKIVETLKRWPAGLSLDHIAVFSSMIGHIVSVPKSKLEWAMLLSVTGTGGHSYSTLMEYIGNTKGGRERFKELIELNDTTDINEIVDCIMRSHMFPSDRYMHAPTEHIPEGLQPFTRKLVDKLSQYIMSDRTTLAGEFDSYGC